MSLKEKLLQIQTEGEGLANRIDQKRKLAELKQQLTQSGLIVTKTKPQEMILDTGLLDVLSEVVDHIPMVEFINVPDPVGIQIYADFAFLFQWDKKGELGEDVSWRELGVGVKIKEDKLIIYSGFYFFPAHGVSTVPSRDIFRKEHYFGDSLGLEQWKDRERLESSIADALWAAGIRPIGG